MSAEKICDMSLGLGLLHGVSGIWVCGWVWALLGPGVLCCGGLEGTTINRPLTVIRGVAGSVATFPFWCKDGRGLVYRVRASRC